MEIHLSADLEQELADVAASSGRPADDLARDAIAGYLHEVPEARRTLDDRYDDLKGGRVKPVGGESFFESLRKREAALLNP